MRELRQRRVGEREGKTGFREIEFYYLKEKSTIEHSSKVLSDLYLFSSMARSRLRCSN